LVFYRRQPIPSSILSDTTHLTNDNPINLSLMRMPLENDAHNKTARTSNDPRHHLIQSARRRRAGTMPSMQFIPENGAMGLPEPHYSMLNSDLSGRNRSGSLTLPSASVSAAFGNPIFSTSWATNDFQPQMMPANDHLLGEDDTNSIVQTLSSLGLDDNDVVGKKTASSQSSAPPSLIRSPTESSMSGYHTPQTPYGPESSLYDSRTAPSVGYVGNNAYNSTENYLGNPLNRPRSVSVTVPERSREATFGPAMMSTSQWGSSVYQPQTQARPGPQNFQSTRNRALSVGDTEWLRAQNARSDIDQNLDFLPYMDRSTPTTGNAVSVAREQEK
jgi:hypothetical protein